MSKSASESTNFENQLERIIHKHPHLQEKRFRLNAKEGRVTMHGRVNSWYQKQMAQEALRNIEGVTEIENMLTVESVSTC